MSPGPVWLTLQLAGATTAILLLLGTPLAWWLAAGGGRLRTIIEAVVAMPLVLPPTVLGFYLLILFNPEGALGAPLLRLTGAQLTFSFAGLVLASVLYSLPFAVQPLQAAFEQLGRAPLEAASVLRASRLDAFFSVACPLARRGFLTATVLGFAHTVGEFGVVLMVGGSIPGETRVISIALYEHVERLQYAEAHRLAAGMLVFAFVTLLAVYGLNRRFRLRLR